MFMNVAGLKMFLPSTPYDIKGLLKTTIRDNNPVISFESSRLMTTQGPVPEEDYTIPFGKADIKKSGSDVTVVRPRLARSRGACRGRRAAQEGISVEVVDPRTLVPLGSGDDPQLGAENRSLVIADEAGTDGRLFGGSCRRRTEDAATFTRLEAPVKRVCALQVPIPTARSSKIMCSRPQTDHRWDPRGAPRRKSAEAA